MLIFINYRDYVIIFQLLNLSYLLLTFIIKQHTYMHEGVLQELYDILEVILFIILHIMGYFMVMFKIIMVILICLMFIIKFMIY